MDQVVEYVEDSAFGKLTNEKGIELGNMYKIIQLLDNRGCIIELEKRMRRQVWIKRKMYFLF
jgi:hypothetical protein